MKFLKIIIATIVIAALHILYSMLTCGKFFSWVYKLEPINVWITEEQMTNKFFMTVNFATLIFTFLFVIIFAKIQDSLPGVCRFCKGISYGVIIWLLGVLPGMFSTYMFMAINKTVPIYLAIAGLVWLLIAGVIVGGICGKKAEGEKCCVCS